MDFIKKVFVVITGLVLIAAVVYVIYLSQNAQEHRQQQTTEEGEGMVPEDTTGWPSVQDTLPSPMAEREEPADSVIKDHIADSIRWRHLPQEDIPEISGRMPEGNPNPVFIGAANRILPAVVTIESKMTLSAVPDDDAHRRFWDQFDDDDPGWFRKGSGSGVIISENGYVLTNYHVLENGSSYNVILYDKREFDGTFIGADPNTDVAVLKIEGKNLPSAYMGNSDSVKIGEWVMAVGSPLNFTSTITAGIVSALGRDIRIIQERFGVENFIQTDAVINPGNSGGALVNLNGEVIGINTAIATRTGLYQGYGFAIPSNLAIKVVNDVLKYGEVRRGLLGVSISQVDSRVAKGVGLPRPTGVLIQSLEPGYPAEDAGLQPGDIILKVNDHKIVSVNDLQDKIAQKDPGELVNVTIWRDKRMITKTIELGKAPVSKTISPEKFDRDKEYKDLGLEFRELRSREKSEFDVENGVYIKEVKPGSPSFDAGIRPNVLVISINDQPVTSVSELRSAIDNMKSGDVVKFLIRQKSFTNNYTDFITFVEKE